MKTFLLKAFELLKERGDMNDTARSDEIDRVWVYKPFARLADFGNKRAKKGQGNCTRWEDMKIVFLVANNNRMTGIVSSLAINICYSWDNCAYLTSCDNVNMFAKHIHKLSLALVPPLRTDYSTVSNK